MFMIGDEYVEGMCRNEQHKVRSHLYKDMDGKGTNLYPMCGYGWNRSDGDSYSIFRGNHSNRGTCKLCLKNREAKKPPLKDGWKHKTRWLSMPRTPHSFKCQLGIHQWDEPTWIADRLPNIVRASIEYMNLGKEQKCLRCDKSRKVRYGG